MFRGISLLLLLATLLVARRSEACSCTQPKPACENLFAYTVFIGVAVSSDDESTLFDVNETLNADKPLEKQVRVKNNRHSTCGRVFDAGASYVVYASGTGASLATGWCYPTHPLGADDEDVALARSPTTRTRARIEGTINLVEGYDRSPPPPLTVRAVSETKAEYKTALDESGRFKFTLTPGNYSLIIDHPLLKVVTEDALRVTLPSPKACAKPLVLVVWNGRVSGRVTEKGKPVAGLEVRPSRANEETPYPSTSARTDADGRYLLDELPPGSFRIGVSVDGSGGTTAESPYAETWAPGVASLDAGSLVENFDISLPPRQRVFKVRGRLRDAAGAPIPQTKIHAGRRELISDKLGTFSFEELGGAEVDVSACVETRCAQQLCVDMSCDEKHVRITSDMSITLTIR